MKYPVILLALIIIAGAYALPAQLSDSGSGVTYDGAALSTGDLTITIWTDATGTSADDLVFNETYEDAITDGAWNIILNDSVLDLEFGRKYWKDYSINGTDLDFDSVERLPFYSSVGAIDMTTESVAVGLRSRSTETNSTAIGTDAWATGNASLALGKAANVSGMSSIAVGADTVASGEGAAALGTGAEALADYALAIGNGVNAIATSTIAIGLGTSAEALESIAMGRSANASQIRSIAIGRSALTQGWDSVALGPYSISGLNRSVALGWAANASGENAIAIGGGATAGLDNTVALGHDSSTTTTNQLAVGSESYPLNTVIHGSLNISDVFILQPQAAPGSPVEGMIYFDSTQHAPCYYNSSDWLLFNGSAC